MSKFWKAIKAFFARAMLGFEAYTQGQKNSDNVSMVTAIALLIIAFLTGAILTYIVGGTVFTFIGTCFATAGLLATVTQLLMAIIAMVMVVGGFGHLFVMYLEAIYQEVKDNEEAYSATYGDDIVKIWMLNAEITIANAKQTFDIPDTEEPEPTVQETDPA